MDSEFSGTGSCFTICRNWSGVLGETVGMGCRVARCVRSNVPRTNTSHGVWTDFDPFRSTLTKPWLSDGPQNMLAHTSGQRNPSCGSRTAMLLMSGSSCPELFDPGRLVWIFTFVMSSSGDRDIPSAGAPEGSR